MLTKLFGIIITGSLVGFDDFLLERFVKIAEHFDTLEFSFGDFIEILLNIGGELIINDVIKIVCQEAG